MSLITEVFGDDILLASLAEVKQKIKNTPVDRRERRTYLLKDWAAIKGVKLSQIDFEEVTEDL